MPDYSPYPIFLDLRGRHVLIVGGGGVGLRKARGVVAAGAAATVVSLAFDEGLAALAGVTRIHAKYETPHMGSKQWTLVFAATDDRLVNERIAADAHETGVLCCRCDEPEESDFSSGAAGIIGGVTVVVGTSGASPALATRIRDAAVKAVDPVLAGLVEKMESWRSRVKAELPEGARGPLLKRLAGEEMETCLRIQGAVAAENLFETWLAEARGKQPVPHVD